MRILDKNPVSTQMNLRSFLAFTVPIAALIIVGFSVFSSIQPLDRKDSFFEVKNFAAFAVASLAGLSVYSRFEKNHEN
jgi:hypothetical protein